MGFFSRKTNLTKEIEKRAYAKESLKQAELAGKARARGEYKQKKKKGSTGSGFKSFIKSTAKNIGANNKQKPMEMFGSYSFADPGKK